MLSLSDLQDLSKDLCSFLYFFSSCFPILLFFSTISRSVLIYHSSLSLLQSPRSGSPGYTGGQYSEAGPSSDNKMALTDFGSFSPVVRDRQLHNDWLYLFSILFRDRRHDVQFFFFLLKYFFSFMSF